MAGQITTTLEQTGVVAHEYKNAIFTVMHRRPWGRPGKNTFCYE
jgi:hypothetical protein